MLKQFTYNRVNVDRLSHLMADDLFREDTKQIFDSKTGKHIGYVNEGRIIEFDTQDEIIEISDQNKNQLSLNF